MTEIKNEQEANEGSEPKAPEGNTGEGDQAKNQTISDLDRADQIAQMQDRANKKKEELLIREEQLEARKRVGGTLDAGQPTPPPKKLSDAEYAEALERGEVNPMKEDGFA